MGFGTAIVPFQGDDGEAQLLSPSVHHGSHVNLTLDCTTERIPEVPAQTKCFTISYSRLLLTPGDCAAILVLVHVCLQAPAKDLLPNQLFQHPDDGRTL